MSIFFVMFKIFQEGALLILKLSTKVLYYIIYIYISRIKNKYREYYFFY